MIYGPDFSSTDEEGLSDDNDYYDFKKRIRNQQNLIRHEQANSEADLKRRQLQLAFSAISSGKYEVIVGELDKGLDVNADLEYGWTPLLLAATVANEKIIAELLKRGADLNKSRESLTPLMLVCNIATEDEECRSNILACVKLFITSGVDLNSIDRKRRTALMLAAYNGHLEVVKLLLPLTHKEVEDNQRWTALFWAVEGNNTEVVELLLKEGFSSEKTDLRGNTVRDLAHSNGSEDILQLFPQDSYNEEFYIHLNNNQFNFEDTFRNLKKQQKPQFFMDICKILYGTKSENVMPVFRDRQITLLDFLSLNDSKLKDIGVALPYQRNRILGGLYKFHKHPFQPKSIPFVRKSELYTNIDVSSTVLSCIKQLIAMEGSLKFIIENCEDKLSPEESKEIGPLLLKNRRQINRLKSVAQQFVEQAKRWDATLKPADKITRKRWNIPWCNLCLSLGIVSLVVIFYRIN